MKRRNWKWVLVVPLLCGLTACSPSVSSPTSDSTSSRPSTDDVSYQLEVKSLPSKTSYTLYDAFEQEGLSIALVSVDTSGNVIDSQSFFDYRLTLNGTELKDGTILDKIGQKTIVVEATGTAYSGLRTEFTIRVNQYLSFRQYLVQEGNVDTYFHVGDSFDASSLSFRLETEKTDLDNKTLSSSTLLGQNDVTLEIDGKPADGFSFSAVGRYVLTASYPGFEETIQTQTVLYVLDKDSADPENFDTSESLAPDAEEMTVTFSTGNSAQGEENYYSPEDVVIDYGIYEYGRNAYDDWVYAPSKSLSGSDKAETPLLVVPVVLPGGEGEAKEEDRDLIYKTFFGTSEDVEYESLHSYYWKSSYGQLDITGTVTDFFYAGDMTDIGVVGSMTEKKFDDLTQAICRWAKEAYSLDLDDYDSDDDGTIDGIWMVFIGRESNDMTNYWGLSGTTKRKGTKENPEPNNYGFIGLDFIDGSYASGMNKGGDAHVVIHETGHMLGLMDYYAYPSDVDVGMDDYSPLSGLDVMDGGIMDHNPYSKMLFGWVKPYIVYGDCTITIPSSQAKNALIVIPYDNKSLERNEDGKVHFNPFDEYLVLDFYTPSGFNEKGYAYAGDYPLEEMGGRLYHVDARLAYATTGGRYALFEDPDDALTYDGKVAKLISNSIVGSYSESSLGLEGANAFDEIRWISKDGTFLDYGSNKISEDALFQVGDTFSLADYAGQFNNGKLNSERPFTTTFCIDSIG